MWRIKLSLLQYMKISDYEGSRKKPLKIHYVDQSPIANPTQELILDIFWVGFYSQPTSKQQHSLT